MYDYFDSFDSYSYPTYGSNYGSDVLASSAAGAFFGIILAFIAATWLVGLVLMILSYVGTWKMFKKAKLDGWEALVPGHNVFVEFQLAGIPTYWYFLLLVPMANIFVMGWKDIELAKAYGKSAGFGIGLFLLGPIFRPILGLGKSSYIGPQKNNYNMNNYNNMNNSNMNANNMSNSNMNNYAGMDNSNMNVNMNNNNIKNVPNDNTSENMNNNNFNSNL